MKDSVISQIGHIVSGRVRTICQSGILLFGCSVYAILNMILENGLNSELAGNWEKSNLTRYMGSKTIKSVVMIITVITVGFRWVKCPDPFCL